MVPAAGILPAVRALTAMMCRLALTLVVTAGAKATGPKAVKHLAVQTGTNQVTQSGLPLYRFMGDATSGVANGEGINAFGGTWHVVTASGTSAPRRWRKRASPSALTQPDRVRARASP